MARMMLIKSSTDQPFSSLFFSFFSVAKVLMRFPRPRMQGSPDEEYGYPTLKHTHTHTPYTAEQHFLPAPQQQFSQVGFFL